MPLRLFKSDVNEPASGEEAIAPWLWLEVGTVPALPLETRERRCGQAEPLAAAVGRWERAERIAGARVRSQHRILPSARGTGSGMDARGVVSICCGGCLPVR